MVDGHHRNVRRVKMNKSVELIAKLIFVVTAISIGISLIWEYRNASFPMVLLGLIAVVSALGFTMRQLKK